MFNFYTRITLTRMASHVQKNHLHTTAKTVVRSNMPYTKAENANSERLARTVAPLQKGDRSMYTDVLMVRERPRANKRTKKQENGKNVTEQTWEGKYSTLSGKTILYKLR